jgi:RAT1-interacting protein
MPYYQECPIGADLNYGFDRRVERTGDEEEHLDGLCEALQRTWRAYEEGEGGGKSEGEMGERRGGIITWRGMLTRYAPFSTLSRDGLAILSYCMHNEAAA